MNREEVMEYVHEKVLEARREQGGEALSVEELRQLLKDIEYVQLRHKVAQQELEALNAWVDRAGRGANEETLEKSKARHVKEPEPSQWDAAIAMANAAKARNQAREAQTQKAPPSFEAATIEEVTSDIESLLMGALRDKMQAVLLLKSQPNGEQKVNKFWDVFYKVFVHGVHEDAAVAVSLLSAWPRARSEVMRLAGANVRYAAVLNYDAAQEFLMAQPEGERLAQKHRAFFEGIKQKFGEKVNAVSANATALLNCGLSEQATRVFCAEVARLKATGLGIRIMPIPVHRKPQGGGGTGGRTMKLRPGQRMRALKYRRR